MRDLCEGNGSLLLPVLQASSMLCLAGPLQVSNTKVVPEVRQHSAQLSDVDQREQAQVTDMVLRRFDSAAAGDLPTMVLYLIRHATQSSTKQVSLARCIDSALAHCCSDWETTAPR